MNFKIKFGSQTISLPTGRELTVGRSPECWLGLRDDLVSRVHAEFIQDGGRLFVRDRGSRNGTIVNGRRISEDTELRHGDDVKIGSSVLSVTDPEAESGNVDVEALLSQTMGTDEGQVVGLLFDLVEKSVKLGRTQDASRYFKGVLRQISGDSARLPGAVGERVVSAAVAVSAQLGDLAWIDETLHVLASRDAVMSDTSVEAVEEAIKRQANFPGQGIAAYEDMLRRCQRRGDTRVTASLISRVASWRDAH